MRRGAGVGRGWAGEGREGRRKVGGGVRRRSARRGGRPRQDASDSLRPSKILEEEDQRVLDEVGA